MSLLFFELQMLLFLLFTLLFFMLVSTCLSCGVCYLHLIEQRFRIGDGQLICLDRFELGDPCCTNQGFSENERVLSEVLCWGPPHVVNHGKQTSLSLTSSSQ